MTSSSKKRKSSRTTPKGQSTTFSPAKIAVFLENLRSYANVTEACKAAGLDRTSTYIKKQNDPNFAKAWADAYDKGIDAMEEGYNKEIAKENELYRENIEKNKGKNDILEATRRNAFK